MKRGGSSRTVILKCGPRAHVFDPNQRHAWNVVNPFSARWMGFSYRAFILVSSPPPESTLGAITLKIFRHDRLHKFARNLNRSKSRLNRPTPKILYIIIYTTNVYAAEPLNSSGEIRPQRFDGKTSIFSFTSCRSRNVLHCLYILGGQSFNRYGLKH